MASISSEGGVETFGATGLALPVPNHEENLEVRISVMVCSA